MIDYIISYKKYKPYTPRIFYEKSVLNHSTIGLSPKCAIKLIKIQNGIASLAHPNRLMDSMSERKILDFILSLKNEWLDAVECHHESYSDNDIKQYHEYAENHDLLITRGSDFHGNNKSSVCIGIGKGSLDIPDYLINNLLSKRRKSDVE